jgi:hypothetical protein
MSPSRFLSTTSLAAAAIAGSAGCSGGDSCGPGGAPDSGLVASNPAVILTFGQLTGGLNNDCPASDAPAGVISMTIGGTQRDGQGRITLCAGRPDLLGTQALALGFDATAPVRVIDLLGSSSSCTYTVDRTLPLSGTAQASGLCDNGRSAAGFALVVDATLSLTRTCGATVDATEVMLHGRVAVASP